MKTTATNRKIRQFMTDISSCKLIPRPEFQRKLVWTNKDKSSFIDTVLKGYPFPEIYVASGDVNLETGEAIELLVDGQQRITTLYQYFTDSQDLKLSKGIPKYSNLETKEKEDFLQYDVVVRDLGNLEIAQIIEIFTRINSTSYSLNAIEIQNARYNGEFKKTAEEISIQDFFDRNKVFSSSEIRRMQDVRFVLTVIISIIYMYFNRDDLLEEYLRIYNDKFPEKNIVKERLIYILDFIEKCQFGHNCRVWNKVELFTLIVELYNFLHKDKIALNTQITGKKLKEFYSEVDVFSRDSDRVVTANIKEYYKTVTRNTNDKKERIIRGSIISALIH